MIQKSEPLCNNNGDRIYPPTPFSFTLTQPLTFNSSKTSEALTYDNQGHPKTTEEPTEAQRAAALWQLPDNAIVRTHEAALMLRRSHRTVQNWRYQRKGPAYQLGTPVTYRIGDLRSYMDGCTTRP